MQFWGLTEQMIIKHLELISDTAAAAHRLTIFFVILIELTLKRLIIN